MTGGVSAVEGIVCRVRHVEEGAGALAGPLGDTAPGVEPLARVNAAEPAGPALLRHLKLKERDVVGGRAGRAAGELGGHRAAVGELPGRAGIVAADGLAIDNEGRDRLAELPGELAGGVG